MKYWSHLGVISLVFSIILDIIQFVIRIFFENFIPNNFSISRLLFFSGEITNVLGIGLLMIGILQHYDDHIAFTRGMHKIAKFGLASVTFRMIAPIMSYLPLQVGNFILVIISIFLVIPTLIVLFYTFRLQTTSSTTQYIKGLLGLGFGFPVLHLVIRETIDFLIDRASQTRRVENASIIYLGSDAILYILYNLIFIGLILLVRSHQQRIITDSTENLLYKEHDDD